MDKQQRLRIEHMQRMLRTLALQIPVKLEPKKDAKPEGSAWHLEFEGHSGSITSLDISVTLSEQDEALVKMALEALDKMEVSRAMQEKPVGSA